MGTGATRSSWVLSGLVVALIAAAVYLPTLRAGFVYDDSGAIVDNPYIHDQRNLGDVLTGRVLARDVMDNNRPLCLLSTMADVAVWGDRPMGFHLTNVLLHAATAALLALLLMRLLAARVPSGGTVDGGPRRGVQLAAICGAVVFAVHPVTSEAVCVPSFREDLLVAFFIVLGLNLAAAFPGRSRAATWLLGATVTLCLLAAVASKESGIAGAALITLYVWLFRRTEWDARWAWMLAGAWLTGAGFLVARFLLAPASSAIFVTTPVYPGGSFPAMLRIEPRILVYQLETLIRPSLLCADPGPYSLRGIGWPAVVAVLGGMAALAAVLLRRSPGGLFAMALFFVPLLPVSNLVPLYCPVADRYLYLPSAGLALGVTVLVHAAWRRRRWLGAATVAVLLPVGGLLAGVTLDREAVWRQEVSLWTDTVRKNPASVRAANNLGFALYDRGEYDLAVREWRRAISLSEGRHADAWAGLAIGLEKLGHAAEAEEAYRKAVALERWYGEPERLVRGLIWSKAWADALETVAQRVREAEEGQGAAGRQALP